MADFKLIATPTLTAAAASVTSSFTVPGEFTHFSFLIPPSSGWCATTTCAFNIQGSRDNSTFYDVAYSNNPATTTSAHAVWSTAGSAAVSGAWIITEALQFIPYARFRTLNTATVAVTIAVYGRKFD